MKLDWDQIRELLREVESLEDGDGIRIIGYSPEQWRPINLALGLDAERNIEACDPVKFYHARLLVKEGFVEATVPNGHVPEDAYILSGLSWDGHSLLESIRDDGTWNQIKAKLASMGWSASVATLKVVAEVVTKENLS